MTLPRPSHDGELIEAPHYIRVRPGWLEKALFMAVFVQIMLALIFLVFGSQPARELVERDKITRQMICDALGPTRPDLIEGYVEMGYCRSPATMP
jgi:hypothetical protein